MTTKTSEWASRTGSGECDAYRCGCNGYRLVIVLWLFFSAALQAQSEMTVHGFFSQAYGITNGNQIFGLTSGGTTDYRSLALQFHFQTKNKHNVAIQLAHRRWGRSPLAQLTGDVLLDWGFYRYAFNDIFSIKTGKILLPLGIYNELRDVGIALPFYSPPFTPYSESNFTAKTLDGLVLVIHLPLNSAWTADIDLYAGEFRWNQWFIYRHPLTGTRVDFVREQLFKKAFGARLWINTPLDGLRFGGSSLSGENFSSASDESGDQTLLGALSFDAGFDRCFFRSEAFRMSVLEDPAAYLSGFYVQGGIFPHPRISLNAQYDDFDIQRLDVLGVFDLKDVDYHQELALGINVHFSSSLIFKTEGHWVRGYTVEEIVDFNQPPAETRFLILSLTGSF